MTLPLIYVGDSVYWWMFDIMHARGMCYDYVNRELTRIAVDPEEFPHTRNKFVFGTEGSFGWAHQTGTIFSVVSSAASPSNNIESDPDESPSSFGGSIVDFEPEESESGGGGDPGGGGEVVDFEPEESESGGGGGDPGGGGEVVEQNSNKVDHINGWIILDEYPESGRIVATYREHQARVKDAWVDNEDIELEALPLISVDVSNQSSSPYGLGTNATWLYWDVKIEILGRHQNHTRQIAAQIAEDCKYVPIFNFSNGYPLNSDGTINTSFNRNAALVGYYPCAEGRFPNIQRANPRRVESQKLNHRYVIDFQLFGTSDKSRALT
jgi:hypothetical protein